MRTTIVDLDSDGFAPSHAPFHAFALLLIALLAALYCLPIFTGTVAIGQWDNFYFIWEIWTLHHNLFIAPQSPWATGLLYHPHAPVAMIYQSLPIELLGAVLMKWFSPHAVYNGLVLGSLATTGWAMYWCAGLITRDRFAALAAALLFAFNQNMLNRVTYGHLNLLQVQALPLLIVALILLERRNTPLRQLFYFGAFVLLGLANAYYFIYLLGFVLVAWFGWGILRGRMSRAFVIQAAVLSAMAGGVILLIYFPMQLGRSEARDMAALKESITAYAPYSNDVATAFIPQPHHPLWRHATTFLDDKMQHGEVPFYGFTVMGLFLFSALLLRWRNRGLWVAFTLAVLVLSFGPVLKWMGSTTGIPLPYWPLTKMPLIWGLRAPSRMNSAIVFGAALVIAAAIVHWRHRLPARAFLAAYPIVLLLILFENLHLDHGLRATTRFFRMQSTPAAIDPVYREIGSRDDIRAIMELPASLLGPGELYDYRSMYQLSAHGKPTMSGRIAREDPDWSGLRREHPVLGIFYHPDRIPALSAEERAELRRDVPAALRTLGVDAVLLQPREWNMPQAHYDQLRGLIVEVFGDRLQPRGEFLMAEIGIPGTRDRRAFRWELGTPAERALLVSGFSPNAEHWGPEAIVWMEGERATLRIPVELLESRIPADRWRLTLDVHVTAPTQDVTLAVDGTTLSQWQGLATGTHRLTGEVDARLLADGLIIDLAFGDCTIPGNGDDRCLSAALLGFGLEAE